MSDIKKEEKNQEQLEAQLKRALADYQNLEKRFAKEKEEVVRFANQSLLLRLLGIMEGFEMVMKQFQELVNEQGFEKVELKEGDAFDASTMEAIDGEGKVVERVYSQAYKLHDKIVRPGRVKVRK
jgi:molecular chaperone GrpE